MLDQEFNPITPEQNQRLLAEQGVPAAPPAQSAPAPVLATGPNDAGVLAAFMQKSLESDKTYGNLEQKLNQAAAIERQNLLGKEAIAYAQQNNLPLDDPRVTAMAGAGTINPVEKGLSFLSGVVGLPFNFLRKAVGGQDVSFTDAFKPEQTAMKNARQAIAALDVERATALSKIEDLRQRNRVGIMDALGPTLRDLNKANQPPKLGTLEERMRLMIAQDIFPNLSEQDIVSNGLLNDPRVNQAYLTYLQEKSNATTTGGQKARIDNPLPPKSGNGGSGGGVTGNQRAKIISDAEAAIRAGADPQAVKARAAKLGVTW